MPLFWLPSIIFFLPKTHLKLLKRQKKNYVKIKSNVVGIILFFQYSNSSSWVPGNRERWGLLWYHKLDHQWQAVHDVGGPSPRQPELCQPQEGGKLLQKPIFREIGSLVLHRQIQQVWDLWHTKMLNTHCPCIYYYDLQIELLRWWTDNMLTICKPK